MIRYLSRTEVVMRLGPAQVAALLGDGVWPRMLVFGPDEQEAVVSDERRMLRDAFMSDAAAATCDHGTVHWFSEEEADALAVVALRALRYGCDNVCVLEMGHEGECR